MRVGKSCLIIGLSFLLVCCSTPGFCNDSLMHRLLLRIDSMQVHHDAYYADGIFPSFRKFVINGRVYKDENIFFSGIICLTLRRIKPQLGPHDQEVCDSIISRVRASAHKFRNQKGRPTYNFGACDTIKPFFLSWPLSLLNKSMHVADDFDDTAIMQLALDEPDSVAVAIHNLMQDYTNKDGELARTTLRDYKKFPAYSVWFGKKMLVELDACVLSNTLYMVQAYNLPWTNADSASLDFLVHMVQTKDYLKYPNKLSVYYKTAPIIIFHLARLMSIKPIPQLEKLKPQLINDATALYNSAGNPLDKIILRTALLHWDVSLPKDELFYGGDIINGLESNNFVFFIASASATFPKFIAYPLVESGITRINYYCPAYNDCLLLEYLAEQKKYDENPR